MRETQWRQTRSQVAQWLYAAQHDATRAAPHSDLAVAYEITIDALADLLQVLSLLLTSSSA